MKARAEATIENTYGFHARPSTTFSQKAGEFASTITVRANGIEADGKSIMALMALGAPQGTHIEIEAEGEDAGEAVAALKAHVDDRFGGIE